MSAPAAVSIRGLVKRYGDLAAVDGLDLDVASGACVALLGPNGAGKTSALRVATCTAPFDAGAVEVLGLDVRRHPREVKARIGLVTQEDSLDVDLTVIENLLVHASYFRIPPAEAARRAEGLLAFSGLTEKRRLPLDALSGGMRRRLAISRALLPDPSILVLDEPTTGLDPHARHAIWERVRALKAEGRTILLTTHYMEEAANLADEVVVLDRGRRIAAGVPRDLVRAHAGVEVVELRRRPFAEGAAAAAYEAARARLAGADARLEEHGDTLYARFDRAGAAAASVAGWGGEVDFVHRPATLEDVFLRLTGRGLDA